MQDDDSDKPPDKFVPPTDQPTAKPVPQRISAFGLTENSIMPGQPAEPGAQLDSPNTPDAIEPSHPESIITAGGIFIFQRPP